MSDINCPFCAIASHHEAAIDTAGISPAADDQTSAINHPRIIAQNQHAIVIRDGYPVTPGHTLIIPKRHIGSYFSLTADEKTSMHALLEQAKTELDQHHQPAAYNIGINDGPAAGQTVPHCHMHLIPRYHQDVSDPRGGVRWVVAEKADYWSDRS